MERGCNGGKRGKYGGMRRHGIMGGTLLLRPSAYGGPWHSWSGAHTMISPIPTCSQRWRPNCKRFLPQDGRGVPIMRRVVPSLCWPGSGWLQLWVMAGCVQVILARGVQFWLDSRYFRAPTLGQGVQFSGYMIWRNPNEAGWSTEVPFCLLLAAASNASLPPDTVS